MYRHRGVVTVQECWLNDLQDNCFVPLQDLNICRQYRSRNKKRKPVEIHSALSLFIQVYQYALQQCWIFDLSQSIRRLQQSPYLQ